MSYKNVQGDPLADLVSPVVLLSLWLFPGALEVLKWRPDCWGGCGGAELPPTGPTSSLRFPFGHVVLRFPFGHVLPPPLP